MIPFIQLLANYDTSPCPACDNGKEDDGDCSWCEGKGFLPDLTKPRMACGVS